MAVPVFVIHGIANRSEDTFAQRVARLAERTRRTDVYPVYWGDLGARYELTTQLVPRPPAPRTATRGGPDATDDADLLALAVAHADHPAQQTPEARIASLTDGVRVGLEDADEDDPVLVEDIIAAVEEAWHDADVAWLWHVDDPELLTEIGAAAGLAVLGATSDGERVVRSSAELRAAAGVALRTADRVAAATMGTAAARLASWVRVQGAEAMAQNLGDLLVYQRHRDEIQERVWQSIRQVDPAAGSDDAHRVHLAGHSLGAVIAMDLATRERGPVYAASITTFGSMWSLLHLWHPHGAVPAYRGTPVLLPDAVRRWTNVWDPLDLLAFLAEPAFVHLDGTSPRDVELRRAKTLNTHSVYWDSPQMIAELAALWGDGSEPDA